MAAYYGKQDLMKLLVPENGQTHVDVNAVGEMLPSISSRSVCNISCLGGDYGTALQAAAARGHEDVVQYLLAAGAKPNIPGGCFSHFKGRHDEQLRLGGDYGSALCAACVNGHEDVVKRLLQSNGITRNQGECMH